MKSNTFNFIITALLIFGVLFFPVNWKISQIRMRMDDEKYSEQTEQDIQDLENDQQMGGTL